MNEIDRVRSTEDVELDADHVRLAAEVARVELPEIVAPASQQAVANGIRLHYLDWGNHAGPPILFLHGGGLTAHTWDLICLVLRASAVVGHTSRRISHDAPPDTAWSNVAELPLLKATVDIMEGSERTSALPAGKSLIRNATLRGSPR